MLFVPLIEFTLLLSLILFINYSESRELGVKRPANLTGLSKSQISRGGYYHPSINGTDYTKLMGIPSCKNVYFQKENQTVEKM